MSWKSLLRSSMASSVMLNSGRRSEAVSISVKWFSGLRGDILSGCTWGHIECNIPWCLPVPSSDGWQKCSQTQWAYPTGVSVCVYVFVRKRNFNNAQLWWFLIGTSAVHLYRLWWYWVTSIILCVCVSGPPQCVPKAETWGLKLPCAARWRSSAIQMVCERESKNTLKRLI